MINILIPTSYFPPISYLKAILSAKEVTIEQHEYFIKKTYRNRCQVAAANGVINLSVPVEEATRRKVIIKDVKIDYSTDWQKQHFKSIESAYNSSPFYEYLVDDFMFVFEKKVTFLLDLNLQVLDRIFGLLETKISPLLSEIYLSQPNELMDLRNEFTPKQKEKSTFINETSYSQVFANKHGFQKDLSCLDLFFNLGSEAYSYLIDVYG